MERGFYTHCLLVACPDDYRELKHDSIGFFEINSNISHKIKKPCSFFAYAGALSGFATFNNSFAINDKSMNTIFALPFLSMC